MNKAGLVFLVIFPLFLYGENIKDSFIDKNPDISAIKRELIKEKEEVSKIDASRASLVKKLKLIEKTIATNEALLNKINEQYILLKSNKETIEKNIAILNNDISILVNEIRKGNIYFVDNKGVVNLKLLMFSNSYHEMIRNLEIVEKVNLKMNEKINLIVAKRNQIEKLNQELSDKLKEIDMVKKVKWEALRDLQNERTVYLQTYAMLNQDKKSKESYLNILTSKYEDINKRFQSVYKEKSQPHSFTGDGTSFAKYKGSLDWPVKGRIIESFGVKYVDDLKTEIFNKGVKIEVQGDGFVRAVFDGVVKYVDWIKGYGNLIIVSHEDGYYTIYANIDDVMVKVGQKINKNEKIGIIDVDIKEIQHYLYFEIRKNNNALNPQEWLKKEVA